MLKKRFICFMAMVSLALQGCQQAEPSDTFNDDWLVGAWSNQNTCTDGGLKIQENGVWSEYVGMGAWRFIKNELALTTIFDGGDTIPIGDVHGIDITAITASTVRYKVLNHDQNKSMITSGPNGSGPNMTWINCAMVTQPNADVEPTQATTPPAPAANGGKATNSIVADANTLYSEEITCRGYINDFEDGLGLRLVQNKRGDAITSNDACNAYIENETPAFRNRVLSVCWLGSTCTIRGRVAMSSRGTYYWWQSIKDVSLQ